MEVVIVEAVVILVVVVVKSLSHLKNVISFFSVAGKFMVMVCSRILSYV